MSSLLPSSQLTLTKSNEHLTVIHEDKEELYIPQPLQENISRIRANTFSGPSDSGELQIKLSRSSTVYESPLKRSSKTLSLRNSQEVAVDNCGSEKLLRQNRTIGSPNLSESPSPRGRRQIRSKSSDVKSQSLPAKETSQRIMDHKRSLSLSTADEKTTSDSKKNLISKLSPRKLNVSGHNNSPLRTSRDIEQPWLKEEFFNEKCYATPISLHKAAEIDRLANSRIKNRELAQTIQAANFEDNQRKKEIYINAILERGVSECPSLIPLTRTNKQLFQSLVEIQERIKRLRDYAKTHQVPNEFLYYCSRILQALDFLDTKEFDCSGPAEVIQKSDVDTTSISFLQTLAGVLESELFHIQEEQAAELSKQIDELKKLHDIIKNLPSQLKLHISHDKTSLEQKNKKNKYKRYSGTSSNSRQTMEFILGKISEITSPNPKTNLLISEIILLIDKNTWMKAILTNDSNLNVKFEAIKLALFKSYQLEVKQDTHEHVEFWEALLDIPADPIFHKKFITSQHKFSNVLCSDQSLSSTEQLFFVLNEKFAVTTPYQRKQILQLALYWLQSPLQIGLRNLNLPNEIDSVELRKARPLIKSLIAQVKNHRCLALYGMAQQLKDALKDCVAPILTKPDLTHAISPKQLFKSIAAGACKGSNYEQAITDLCKTLRTLCMYGFLNITHAELHKPPGFDEHGTSIAGLAKYSSFLSYWVLESIFGTWDEPKQKIGLKEEINKRQNRSIERMIEFFIDVCVRLVDEKNICAKAPADYHTAYAIYVILTKSYVEKLYKESTQTLSISTDHLMKLESLATLFHPNETFINLRKKYEMVPCHIPALNFICRDLTTSLDSSLVPIIHKEKINFTAINKIGDCTLAISQSQASLDYSNACVFNLPDEFSRIEKTGRYCNASNKFDDHLFDNIFYSIAHGLLPVSPLTG